MVCTHVLTRTFVRVKSALISRAKSACEISSFCSCEISIDFKCEISVWNHQLLFVWNQHWFHGRNQRVKSAAFVRVKSALISRAKSACEIISFCSCEISIDFKCEISVWNHQISVWFTRTKSACGKCNVRVDSACAWNVHSISLQRKQMSNWLQHAMRTRKDQLLHSLRSFPRTYFLIDWS